MASAPQVLAQRTDAEGRFVAPLPAAPQELRAECPGHLTALVAVWRPELGFEPTVVGSRAAAAWPSDGSAGGAAP